MTTTIVTRSGKGSPLTNTELDANFTNLKTTADAAISSTGNNTLSGNLNLGDNVKAQFGAGNDLQIYHDGNHSYVSDTGAGYLRLKGSNFVQIFDASDSIMANFESGGGVFLSHNGADRFATTSTGIDVTGTISGGAATFTTADNTDTVSLISTDADANAGPNVKLFRNSSSPADGDNLGRIDFIGKNDAAEQHNFARIAVTVADASNATEDGTLEFSTSVATTENVSRILMGATETVINDDSKDLDFRVESNNHTHMLFVDGGNDRITIGGTDGTGSLHVKNKDNSGSDVHVVVQNTTANRIAGYKVQDESGNTGINLLYDNGANHVVLESPIGDLTLDVAGNINLDADGGQVVLKDGGTQYGNFLMNNSGDLSLHVETQDKDIKFTGNDGGSYITALTFDMSAAGFATLNSGISVGDNATFLGSQNTIRADDGFLRIEETDGTDITYLGDITGSGVGGLFLYNHGGSGDTILRADAASTIAHGLSVGGSAEITSTAAIPLKVAYNSTNYMAIGHEFTDVVSGGVGHIFKISGTQKMLLSASGLDVTGSAKLTGSASANTDSITIGFTAPDGEIKVKNSSGAPASNLDFYTTNSSGTTAVKLRILAGGGLSISTGNVTMDGTLIGVSALGMGGAITGATNVTASGTVSVGDRLLVNGATSNAQLSVLGDASLRAQNVQVAVDGHTAIGFFNASGTDVGGIAVNASGASINLGGTAVSNTLDDYEEGTFTPTYTVAGGGTAGTVTSTNVGTYTKVGRVVTVAVTSFYVPTSGTVPTAYNMTLPFAVGLIGGQSGNGSGREVSQTGASMFISVGNNATTAVIKALNGAAPPANAFFNFSFTYQTA